MKLDTEIVGLIRPPVNQVNLNIGEEKTGLRTGRCTLPSIDVLDYQAGDLLQSLDQLSSRVAELTPIEQEAEKRPEARRLDDASVGHGTRHSMIEFAASEVGDG